MNLHLLRLFAAVAHQRSFSRAAEVLRISQPAVSKGVRELEIQLSAPLLERGSGGVRLTEAGHVLIGHAQALFAIEQTAEEALDALRGLHRGTLRVGASTTVATYFLAPLLNSFARAYPAIELHLTSANTSTIVDLLVRRELDIALAEGPIELDGVIVKPWRDDELVFVVAVGHPLAARKGLTTLADLADETIVLREHGSGTRNIAWEALKTAGLAARRILEVSGNEAIAQIVAAGLGVGILSSAAVADHIALGRLKRLKFKNLTIRRTLTRLSLPHRQPSPATVAFDQLLDDAV
jgi:DNA-binding transcriptional LysR family regulator